VAAAQFPRDAEGRVFRSAEVIMATGDETALETARALGFSEIDRADLGAAGLTLVRLRAPDGVGAPEAVGLLRTARPQDAVDLNYLYTLQQDAQTEPARADIVPASRTSTAAAALRADGGRAIALIDGPLDPDRAPPGFRLVQRRFAEEPAEPDRHAARVAAVLADAIGAGAGTTLLAADVVSELAGGATADALARALDWAAAEGAAVINVSLAGPPNAAVAAVVSRLAALDVVIVAAAGNDGPAAPPAYPAAYPGVVAVTAVDYGGRIWRLANRGDYLDAAALGVDVKLEGRTVSGTSYAAPVVAGLLFTVGGTGVTAEATLAIYAADLGEPGRDAVFGLGVVQAGTGRFAAR
jgi:subtilisin family serine protease